MPCHLYTLRKLTSLCVCWLTIACTQSHHQLPSSKGKFYSELYYYRKAEAVCCHGNRDTGPHRCFVAEESFPVSGHKSTVDGGLCQLFALLQEQCHLSKQMFHEMYVCNFIWSHQGRGHNSCFHSLDQRNIDGTTLIKLMHGELEKKLGINLTHVGNET